MCVCVTGTCLNLFALYKLLSKAVVTVGARYPKFPMSFKECHQQSNSNVLSQPVCDWCRGQQGADPTWGAREEALEYEGIQELPCVEKRVSHPTQQCSEQIVCRHELVDNHNIRARHVTLVNGASHAICHLMPFGHLEPV